MNKINKFLVLFLLFFCVLLWGTWEFIQSERFSSILVSRVANKIEVVTEGKFKFTRIEFQLFPPATLLKNVEIEYANEELKTTVDLEAASLGLYFNILDVFSSKFKIQKIKINDGFCKATVEGVNINEKFFKDLIYKKDNKSEKLKIIDIFEVYSKIFNLQEKMVVSNLEVNNLKMLLNESSLFFDNLRITPTEKFLQININLMGINLYTPQKGDIDLNFDQLLVNAKLEEQNLEVENVLLKHKHSSLTGTFLIKQNKYSNMINSDLIVSAPIKEFVNYIPENEKANNIEGFVNLNILAKGDVGNLNIQAKVNLDNFYSEWIKAQKAQLKIYKQNNVLGLSELYLFDDGGSLKVNEPKEIYNLAENKFLKGNANVILDNLQTGTFLHYLRKSLAPLEGKFTGNINADWSMDGLAFETKEKIEVYDLKLVFPDSKHPVITNPHVTVSGLNLRVDWNGKVNIDTTLDFLNNNILLQGEIFNDSADFKMKADKFDFKLFGPISGIEFEGSGFMNVDVTGPLDNIEFKFNTNLDNFKLIDINFGKVAGDFTLMVRDQKLILNNLDGEFNNAKYISKGEFNFGDDGEFELDFDLKKSNLQDLKLMFSVLFSKMSFLPKDLDLTATSKLKLSGGYSLEELIIEGTMNFKELFFWGEDFDWLKTNINFVNKNLNLNNMHFAKSASRGLGSVLFDLNKEIADMNMSFSKARLSEFNFYKNANLGYDGEVSGEYSSRGHVSHLEEKGFAKTTSATLAQRPALGSEITYHSKNSKLKFEGKLLGEMIKIDSLLDVSGAKEKNSHIDLQVETSEISNLFGLLSEHNIKEKDLEGEVSLKARSNFSLENLGNLDFLMEVDKLSLFTKQIFFSLNQNSRFEIENGIIKDWNINWNGKNFEFISKGNGNFSDKVNIRSYFKIDPSVLELLTEKIQFSDGIIEGDINLSTDTKKILTTSSIRAKDLAFRASVFPSQFNNVSLAMDGLNRNFYIQSFKGVYAGGKFSASGDLDFKIPFPKLNLDIVLENANIPIMKKSNFVADARTNLRGDGIPYLLTGAANLVNVNIVDEFSELSKRKQSKQTSSRFIPEVAHDEDIKILKYNFDLNILRPIIVKNNIADFKVNGQFNIQGYDANPLLKGEMDIVPGTSKFIFKNNEFTLDEGKVIFLGEEKDNSPSFKFLGTTTVNEYFIKMDFSGKPSNFNLNFSSEPLLTQEDIVSLLTVGLTLDKSKGLNASDLQSVTSIGLGSLLLDQFGINQGLKSSLGLKLSVLPYYQKSQISPISSATSSGDLSTSRLRSATNLRVEKKINKKMDMSVSTTVGGNTEQKRAMNLDYNINKSYSVKGVYEVRSSTGSESQQNSNSMGLDFIFRRTFK